MEKCGTPRNVVDTESERGGNSYVGIHPSKWICRVLKLCDPHCSELLL